MHAHTAGHFGLREAVLQQVDGPKSAGLKFREITSLTFGKCHAPHRSRSPTACHYILQGLIVRQTQRIRNVLGCDHGFGPGHY